MRFYKNKIPEEHANVVAKFIDHDKKGHVVNVTLPEYDDMKAIIVESTIGKKIKTVRKFLAVMKKELCPFFVQELDNGMPILVSIRDEEEKAAIMNRYKLACDIHSLTFDLIHQDTIRVKTELMKKHESGITEKCIAYLYDVISACQGPNVDADFEKYKCESVLSENGISPEEINAIKNGLQTLHDSNVVEKLDKEVTKIISKYRKKFLWTINKKLCSIENIQPNTFSYYLENPLELANFSKLSIEDQCDIEARIRERTVTSKVTVNSSIDITVTSKNSIDGLNKIVQMVKDQVDGFYYQDPPHYKLSMKRDSDVECSSTYASLTDKINEFANEKGIKVIVKYDPQNEEISEKTVRLEPLNRQR